MVPEGYATGAAKGLTTADLPDHAYWEQWFPADWVSEMREQIRLWFYSQLFMSVALTGRAPFRRVLGYEKMLDEKGREMHSSWGNTIDAPDAFARMGADVMRWQFCAQPPDRNLLFGFGPGAGDQAASCSRSGTRPRSSSTYGERRGASSRATADLVEAARSGDLQPLDRWLVARTRQLVDGGDRGVRAYLTVDVIRAFEAFVDDLSNWYIRRSRRRFWDGDEAGAADALVRPRPGAARDRAGHAVPRRAPLADARRAVSTGAPTRSSSPAGPRRPRPDAALLDEVAEVRRVAALGHQARQSSGLKVRQPLRRLVVDGAPLAQAARGRARRRAAREGGRVRARRGDGAARQAATCRCSARSLGKELGAVRAALQAGEFEELGGGRFRAAGHELGPDEVLVERTGKEGWAVAAEDGVTVALDTRSTTSSTRRRASTS